MIAFPRALSCRMSSPHITLPSVCSEIDDAGGTSGGRGAGPGGEVIGGGEVLVGIASGVCVLAAPGTQPGASIIGVAWWNVPGRPRATTVDPSIRTSASRLDPGETTGPPRMSVVAISVE
jgi:hypothetical protein